MELPKWLTWLGQAVWRWMRVIWVCRIPVASVVGGGLLLAATPQARDLFADLGIKPWQWVVFLTFVFLWAWIAHAAARRSLQYDYWVPEAHTAAGLTPERRSQLQAEFYWPALIVPRAIGLLAFFFVGWAICRTRRNIADAIALPEAKGASDLLLALLAGVILFAIVYVWQIWNWKTQNPQAKAPAAPPSGFARSLAGTAPIFAKAAIPAPAGTLVERLFFVARLVVLGVLAYTIFDPHSVASVLPRLFFAPLLFAGIVILLGELAAWSHRLRTPLLLVLAAGAGICLFVVDQFHDVYWLNARPQAGQSRQIDMPTAVARWRSANKCEEGSGNPCPRPILIAGAGGASRAGFLTATVVGALMDLDRDPQNVAQYGSVRNRIFAMSLVSGSSVGGVVMRAAMTDAALNKREPLSPPCVAEGTGSWFGQLKLASDIAFDVKKSWRDCFQVVLAGDFLSPVVVGLVYRDNFPLANPLTGEPLWPDRARLLEQGFERRYRQMTLGKRGRTCKDTNDVDDRSGLCRPFGYHPDPATAGAWIPLLFINSTSVSTGRRVVISDIPIGQKYTVPATPTAASSEQHLLPFAYDLWELRDHRACQKAPDFQACRSQFDDVRLSTAAGISARFPIISPHGILRYRNVSAPKADYTGDVVDRVVDGGYFENDGLATIADVAAALKAWKLEPVVIRVTNEPVQLVEENDQLGPGRPPRPDDEELAPFDDAVSIFRALNATRSGHEDGHTAYVKSVVGDDRLYEVGVYKLEQSNQKSNPFCRQKQLPNASMGQVSMSWWMSQPVQAYLDAQLCVSANWERLECELREGRVATGGQCVQRKAEDLGLAKQKMDLQKKMEMKK